MEWVLFSIFSLVAIFGALAVVTASDPFVSALSLIVHFASLGVLYLTLHAPFVAIAQVIVYAGAVVVLFLFVLAYLGDRRELIGGERDAHRTQRWFAAGLAIAAGAVLSWVVLYGTGADQVPAIGEVDDAFGSPEMIGEVFLTRYLLEFELTSLVLLVAAIGGIVLGLTGRERHRRLRATQHSMSADQTRRLRAEEREARAAAGGRGREGDAG